MRASATWAMMIAAIGIVTPAGADDATRRPVVAELFTSEGCSSCPPAEALLTELSQRAPGVLALAFHVTYWDGLGWPDRFALPAATIRQRNYATWLHLDTIYTPQLIVDGVADVVGSDRAAVGAALAAAARPRPAVPVTLLRVAGGVRFVAGSGEGSGDLLLIGFDSRHTTTVARGENAGRTLLESNVVRSVASLGSWAGSAVARTAATPRGEHLAGLVQAADGRILGAAVLP
jgi:hypothetical protein